MTGVTVTNLVPRQLFQGVFKPNYCYKPSSEPLKAAFRLSFDFVAVVRQFAAAAAAAAATGICVSARVRMNRLKGVLLYPA